MKKIALSVLSIAILTSAAMAPAGTAMAQWRDAPPPRWDDRRGPPPPRWDRDRDRHHRHHDNTGKVIAGGLAAGIVGGLIGGALANSGGPRYVEPPPPPPRCWFEDQRVRNAYDGGWHMESIRVCR
ncbi:hypothetical protein MRBLMR1_006043 [Neorhizobium sp. LMR1-1-1.1]|jgi:hypothetical protein